MAELGQKRDVLLGGERRAENEPAIRALTAPEELRRPPPQWFLMYSIYRPRYV